MEKNDFFKDSYILLSLEEFILVLDGSFHDEYGNYSKGDIQINDQQNILILKNNFPIKVLRNYHFANSVHLVDYINIFARGKIVSIKKIFDLKKKKIEKIFVKKSVFLVETL